LAIRRREAPTHISSIICASFSCARSGKLKFNMRKAINGSAIRYTASPVTFTPTFSWVI
jgi:hypothetical protein